MGVKNYQIKNDEWYDGGVDALQKIFHHCTAVCLILALGAPTFALAAFINDSETTDIEYVGGVERTGSGIRPPPSVAPAPQADEPVLIFEEPKEEESSITEILAVPVSNPSQSANPQGNTAGNGQEDEGTPLSVEEILSILFANNALIASDESGIGTDLSSWFSGTPSGGLWFVGSRLREAFKARGIGKLSFPGSTAFLQFSAANRSAQFSKTDFAIVVSATLLRDELIEDVSFTTGVLRVRYSARGRLFAFVPLKYPLTVNISFSNTSVNAITFRYPWYSFFLVKGITEEKLRTRIIETASGALLGSEGEYDAATRVFAAVASILERDVGDPSL